MSANSDSDLNSKIKDIKIELKDYSFFHSPFETELEDKRFIGRNDLREKLKTFLTNNETQSGAYLVTGYRGMGKSSLISKVITEIRSLELRMPKGERFLRILFFLIPFLLLDEKAFPLEINWIAGTILIFSLITLISTDKKFKPLLSKSAPKRPVYVVFKSLIDQFYIRRQNATSLKFRNILQDVFIAMLIILVDDWILDIINDYSLLAKLIIFFISFSVLVWVSLLFNQRYSLQDHLEIKFRKTLEDKWGKKKESIKKSNIPSRMANTAFWAVLIVVPTFFITLVILIWSDFQFPNISGWFERPKLMQFLYPAVLLIGVTLIGLLIWCIVYSLIGLILASFSRQKDGKDERDFYRRLILIGSTLCFEFFITSLFRFIKHKVNFSQLKVVKINLGQDDLRVDDVMRSVVKSLYASYDLHRKNVFWKIVKSAVIFLIVGITYFHTPFFNLFNDAKRELNLFRFTPSQLIVSFKEDSKERKRLEYYLDTKLNQKNIKIEDRVFFALTCPHNRLETRRLKHELTILMTIHTNSFRQNPDTPSIKRLIYNDYNELTEKEKTTFYLLLNSINNDVLDATLAKYPRLVNPPDPIQSNKSFFHLGNWVSFLFREGYIADPIDLKKSSSISKAILYIDLGAFFAYEKLVGAFSPIQSSHKIQPYLTDQLDLWDDFCIFPRRLDYSFWIMIVFLSLILRFLGTFKIFGIVTHHYVRKKLKKLSNWIDSQMETESGAEGLSQITSTVFNVLGFRTRRTIPIAKQHDIERELIDILEEIKHIPAITKRPDFVFIFDELDKIEHNRNIHIKDQEEEQLLGEDGHMGLFSENSARKRQDTIFAIMGSMKHFLNTAKAKFIFIAGREMYDASLADISDRDSFLRSIFHEEIYVNSFLSDNSDNRISDVTSMTENYVCQFLLPDSYREKSLKTYYKYLKTEIYSEDFEKLEAKKKRDEARKIIFTLQNFITYLTYRSSGAPKKITRLFEQYISNFTKRELEDRKNNLIIGHNHKNLYLSFTYFDQYTFGMITYLATPYLLAVNRYIKDFGDKLLVSTSFLVDHLFKFHKTGFSWRNLELTPEIVDIHKAPELRRLISEIITFLSKTHIQPILSGLHNFRFTQRISEEISFLSKVSERESAAFNFTLDESIEIKKHYKRKLIELQKKYESFAQEEYIHSIGFIHMVLGDLHYNDEEYDDAIIEYMEAVQQLRNKNSNEINIYRFVLLIRNMLKLGLTFEKKKTYDSAFMTYGKISSLIIGVREIEIENFGIWETKNGNLKVDDSITQVESFEIINNDNGYTRVYKKPTYPYPKKAQDGDEHHENSNLIKALNQLEVSSEQEDLLLNISLFEGIRLIYQPLLAKLQIIEKNNLGGITQIDLQRVNKEFNYISNAIHRDEKFIITAEYYDKVGDILYYKNGWLRSGMVDRETSKIPEGANMQVFCARSNGMCLKNSKVDKHPKVKGKYYSSPCSACEFYVKSVEELVKRNLEFEKDISSGTKLIPTVLKFLKEETSQPFLAKKLSSNRLTGYLRALGNALSDVGDTFVGCSQGEKVSAKFILFLCDFIEEDNQEDLKNYFIDEKYKPTKLEEAACFHFLSAAIFLRAGDHKEYAFQLNKIIVMIRLSLRNVDHGFLDVYNEVEKWETSDWAFFWRIFGNHKEISRETKTRRFLENLQKFQNLLNEDKSWNSKELYSFYSFLSTECRDKVIGILSRCRPSQVPKDHSLDEWHKAISGLVKKDLEEIQKQIKEEKSWKPFENKKIIALPKYWIIDLIKSRIKTTIVKRVIREIYRAYQNTQRPEIQKFEDILEVHKKGDKEVKRFILNNISISPDIREIIISFSNLLLEFNKYGGTKKAEHHEEITNPLRVINNKVNRVNELFYKVLQNDSEWKELAKKSMIKCPQGDSLIKDSIYCLNEIIRTLKIFGPTFRMNYSTLADAHYHMWTWCKRKETDISSTPEEMKRELETLTGPISLFTFVPNYHKEQAITNYHLAIEVHHEGKAYKDVTEKMYYLDDDFNDNYYHFEVAKERYRINQGKIEDRLKKLKGNSERERNRSKVEEDPYFEFDSYVLAKSN